MITWLGQHLAELLAVLGYFLTLAFIPLVLIRKRQPTSAIAWCMSILLLPYLGTLLFLLIGVPKVDRKLHRKRFQRSRFVRRFISTIEDDDHHSLMAGAVNQAGEWQGVDQLACVVGAVSASQGNGTTMYHEGTAAFADKMAALRDAKHHIHAEYFILRADDTGREFVELLCQRARDGLEVRLLVDAIGSYGARKLLHRLQEAGGQAQRFLPTMAWRRRFMVNLRNHRKILICDGRVAFTGGLNIGDEYLGRSKRYGFWRDTQLQICGPAVLGLQRVFVEDWDFAAGEFLYGAKYFPRPHAAGADKLQVIWSGPDHEHNGIREVYLTAITRARQRLWITTPYFVPDMALLSVLKLAALRGVDVRLLTQSSPPDHWLAYFAARYYWPELLDCGVKIFQYEKGMVHAKLMIADGAWASVGSANLDIRSLKLNFEVNCLLYAQPLIDQLQNQFLQDLQEAREVQPSDLEGRPIRVQLAENVCRLFSPIL